MDTTKAVSPDPGQTLPPSPCPAPGTSCARAVFCQLRCCVERGSLHSAPLPPRMLEMRKSRFGASRVLPGALYFAKPPAQKEDPQQTLPVTQQGPERCRGMLQAQHETKIPVSSNAEAPERATVHP